MRMLGAHMSIEGGVHRALERGAEAQCDAIQIFTRSSHQWKAKPLSDEDVAAFREGQVAHGISPAISHANYLINMATPDAALRARSARALDDEIARCDRLALPYLVIHPGAHMGAGEEKGVERIAAVLNKALSKNPASRARILLETTAGMGTSVGCRFEHLRDILVRLEQPERTGICLDTCHLFAAGHDISTERGYHAVMEDFDRTVGLQRVRAIHMNDSKKGLGCRLDRHEHIGRGALGVTAFWCLLNDERFDGIPMVLETPKGDDLAEDKVNLALLRAQIGSNRPVKGPTVEAPASKAAHRKARTARK